MPSPTVALDAQPDAAVMALVVQGLTDYNVERIGERPQYLVVSARDDSGQAVGGLFGATYCGWLSVQVLWLPAALRGQGLGRRLMEIAETEAVRRACPRVILDTLTFQALPFYLALGYRIVCTLPDFPPGRGERYSLTKMLGERHSSPGSADRRWPEAPGIQGDQA
ncbi:MAG TPA: GNAT family N-acetyltransferase [Burkholderiaceae bacterium]|jgi:GNAT superfamily N-acetyltransferase|nr:GNAT family N-acetyltransferase [Burkholderiaceae bacterium]